MKRSILYLYYDIMNLYGENGNVRMMQRLLNDKGVEVEIDRKTVTDSDIDFMKYDFIYCGCGTERSRNACIVHMLQFKESLKSAFQSGKVMLFTGNSYEMLGKSLTAADGTVYEGMGLFDFTVSEQGKNRYTGDVTLGCDLISDELIGYINKCSTVSSIDKPLFTIKSVVGTLKDTVDGIYTDRFFGTQVIGPILVKNPAFAEYVAELVMNK
ncbi:MAG: hypothetical protein E7513_03045 [Ruminococcaceae bacterium]|nr:hypothetical protein [Oscillospiraceae bacterium]